MLIKSHNHSAMKYFLMAAALLCSSLLWAETPETEQPLSHHVWQQLLDQHLQVADAADVTAINLFDYQALQDNSREDLARYLNHLASVDIATYPREEQFVYWINLYNALTVKLIADNYPVKSITKLGEKLLSFGPWDDEAIVIQGKSLSLNDIEHKILRVQWDDHRIHFAVNCASYGCPNLQGQAFTAENADALLNQAAQDYLQHPRGLVFDDGELLLSSIFDWYGSDFGENSAEILLTLSQYLPDEKAQLLKNYRGDIDYHYDWSLNGVE